MDRKCVFDWLNKVFIAPSLSYSEYTDDEIRIFAHDALILLKEQEEEIENLKQTAQSMMEGICLLKEQEEPKQIVRKQCKKEYEDGSIDYFAEWYCPHCKSLIVRGFDNPSIKFCYKCGKPIDWSK